MKLIDIDRLKVIDNHVHYIKIYNGSAIFMDKVGKLFRFALKFTVEHTPVGEPKVSIAFIEHPHFPIMNIMKTIKKKIVDMEEKGILASLHNKN